MRTGARTAPERGRRRPACVAGDRLASGSARRAGAFVTLIAVAAANSPLRLARLVSFLRPADIVHVLEASSSGALGVGAGFRTAHEITFGRWSGALCAGPFRTLLRHVFLRWVERSPTRWSPCRYHHADSTTSSAEWRSQSPRLIRPSAVPAESMPRALRVPAHQSAAAVDTLARHARRSSVFLVRSSVPELFHMETRVRFPRSAPRRSGWRYQRDRTRAVPR